MARAKAVACLRSLLAPVVMSSEPKMISSATRPPMHTSSRAIICFFEMLVASSSGNCVTMPRAMPRGTMVALCTGSAPKVWIATNACPPSWYAVSLRLFSLMTALLRSAPIMMRSRAYSRLCMVTAFAPSRAALIAATFTRLTKSAPLKPGVPRAMTDKSRSVPRGMTFMADSRICRRPSTSGLGTITCLSKRPGRMRALSKTSGKLVAATTMTPSVALKPSISTSIWLRVIRMYCWSLGLRFPPMASISSMKMMHGACFLAAVKRSRTRRAPTPTNTSSNSEPEV
mmetsp:Transcript_20141/g.34678  ORF Transcript_20141/g.34678 Transcript_20141/m.34678 type:complete len:286 (-) Transcript_20141:69-926(-)